MSMVYLFYDVSFFSVSSSFVCLLFFFFFFKQKTAYEMRISDWSSDVCSSDLSAGSAIPAPAAITGRRRRSHVESRPSMNSRLISSPTSRKNSAISARSEEHTSELQSLMRISYAVFCLKKNNKQHHTSQMTHQHPHTNPYHEQHPQ